MFSCRSRSAEFQMTHFLRKRNCGNSSHNILCETVELQVTDCSGCGSRTAELRDIVYSMCGSETAELQVTEYSLCGGGTVGLQVKALVWKRNCESSSRTKFIVWKRNCVTSKPQYFSLCGSGIAPFQSSKSHTILYAEAELRNFKSQYIPCAEAGLQAKEYSMCGSRTAELRVT